MYRLVVDLLDLARFDAGTIVLDRRALDRFSDFNRNGIWDGADEIIANC